MGLKFTGEVFIPGLSPKRIEKDHLERYRFATKYVLNKTVLDMACGTGYGSNIMAKAGAKFVKGIDISSELIDYGRTHYQRNNLSFEVGDACTFIGDSLYDVIVSFETIEHVEDYHLMLINLHRLLKKNGLLIISTPNRLVTSPRSKSLTDKPKNKFHRVEFSVQELLEVLTDSGFWISRKIYGQRFRRYIANSLLREIHKRIFRPDHHTSPQITSIAGLIQRYIVVIAEKK
jgi:ubiquinone/menaquinone biosynthesis C-methylase UbiE